MMGARATHRRQTVFVGSKIRHLRKENGLTQSALARRIGVQQSDLCRMENGEYKVSLDTLFSILSVFGMDIGEFFREELAPSGPTERDHELLRLFHRLDAQAQDEILDFVRYKGLRRAVSCES
jgi:transcriptional regulator with XRE-family HTH domain